MKSDIEALYSQPGDDVLQRIEQSYQVAERTLAELKAYILDYAFRDKNEEIGFFKDIKPRFQCELFYFLRMFYFESNRPVGSKEELHHYHSNALHSISTYFLRNQSLYAYYRMGRCEFDEQYFTRASTPNPLLPEYSLDFDNRFSTVYSIKIAKFQALELLKDYVVGSLVAVETGKHSSGERGKEEELYWSDKDVYLLENIIAWYENRSINGGNISLQRLVQIFERVFANVKFGNFYRTIQNMRIRKKDRTPYLRKSLDNAEKYMDRLDMMP